MLCLMNILSSFPSVYEILADVTVTPRDHYGIRDQPKGLVVSELQQTPSQTEFNCLALA